MNTLAVCLEHMFTEVDTTLVHTNIRWICLKSIEFGRKSEDFPKSTEFVRKLRTSEALRSLGRIP